MLSRKNNGKAVLGKLGRRNERGAWAVFLSNTGHFLQGHEQLWQTHTNQQHPEVTAEPQRGWPEIQVGSVSFLDSNQDFPKLLHRRTRLQCGTPCISPLSLCGVNKPPLPPLPWTQFPCSFHCFYCWQTMKIWSRNEDKNLTNLSDFSINWIVLPAWNANTWVFL